ncbi:hypothetical protein AAVH_05334 [Aphelenchoides avenae]|nr:hypothetical protein AAVH_05334 [Aphelenchus avenae]
MNEQELASKLRDLQRLWEETLRTKDPKRLAALYHPHGVITYRGTAYYGTEQITKFYEQFVKDIGDTQFEAHHDWTGQAGNGEYLFLKVSFFRTDKPGVKNTAEVIFKRAEDGSYLILHDQDDA